MSKLVETLHADLDNLEARIIAAFQPEVDRLRAIASNEDLKDELRRVADQHAGGIASKLESLAGHLPTVRMLLDNLDRDHPDVGAAPAAAAPATAPNPES